MRVVGVVEHLLLLLLGVARGSFLLQGVAFGCASLAVLIATPMEAPVWLRGAMVSAALLSGTGLFAGFLMSERRWPAAHAGGGEPAWPWPLLLGLSLVALPAASAIAASALLPLWSRIAAQLAAVGFWDGVTRSDPYAGIVILPILAALCVPALVSAAALFSIAFPLLLLPLLAARSRRLPALLAMGAICQSALVLSGWIAVDAFAQLAAQVRVAMAASGDAEVLRVSGQLEHATSVLARTATALLPPLLGMLAWLAFLRPSGAAAAYFTSGAAAAYFTAGARGSASEAARELRPEPAPPRPRIATAPVAEDLPGSDGECATATVAPRARGSRARLALAALGVLMLLFGAADRLRTRASYVSSQPGPGAALRDAPALVRVTFSAELDPSSTLSMTRLVVEPSSGDLPQAIESEHRLAADDPGRRTLEAMPSRLGPGLYRVSWQALPAGGGVPRHGSFCFGVGLPVPADSPGMAHALHERDAGARGRRQTLVGGVLLLALGALLPRLRLRA
jgi:methionine-rich copper-binding protein CopC